MDSNITNEKLILYLYNETDMLDSVLVQKQIDHDPETECEFENLKASLQLLDDAMVSPAPRSVNRILRFAAQNLS